MYYPHDTAMDMGPTAVVPGSTYWSVDRAGFMQSEDRLDFELQPAKNSAGLEQWSRSLHGWNALAGFGENWEDLSQRDSRIEGAVDLLLGKDGDHSGGERDPAVAAELAVGGVAAGLLRQQFVEVKAGSFVIMHHDVFHRGTRRRSADAPWRPMFKQGARRVSDPGRPSWDAAKPHAVRNPFAEAAGISPGTAAVWGSVHSYMQGTGYHSAETTSSTPADVKAAAEALLEGHRAVPTFCI